MILIRAGDPRESVDLRALGSGDPGPRVMIPSPGQSDFPGTRVGEVLSRTTRHDEPAPVRRDCQHCGLGDGNSSCFCRPAKVKGRKEGRKDGWMDGRMEGWKDGRMEGWKDGRMEGWKDGKKEGRKEGRKDGRMEGWKDGRRKEGRKEGSMINPNQWLKSSGTK